MAKRPKLPESTKQGVLYKCGFACIVCQRKADHIHHINKNHSDNRLENLAALCSQHHDEAHTKRELSQNLSPVLLVSLRERWQEELAARRILASSVTAQKSEFGNSAFGSFASWGYINHRRILELSGSDWDSKISPDLARRCRLGGMLDNRGILIRPPDYKATGSYVTSTVYDWFHHGDDHAVHLLYSELVDLLIKRVEPVHLNELNWNRRFVENMIGPGKFVAVTKASYFKKVSEGDENAHVEVRTFKRNLELRYAVDTRNMFGTTAITCSFSGHKTCTALLLVKSIDHEANKLIVSCTPIALGIGFQTKNPTH